MFKRHVINELSSFLDNQLSDEERLKIEEHLKTCKSCNEELTKLKLLSEKLKLWHAPGLDESFDASLRSEIVQREIERGRIKMKKKTLAILIPSGALAAILLILFMGQAYLKQGILGRQKVAFLGSVTSSDKYLWGSGEYRSDELTSGSAALSRLGEGYDFKKGDKLAKPASAGGYVYSRSQSEISQQNNGPQAYPHDQSSAQRTADVDSSVNTGEGSVIIVQPTFPATGMGEKIIRTATVQLEVEDGKETYNKVSQLCQELGGYLANSNFYRDMEGRQGGTITLRIPQGKFITALERLNALGKVENVNSDSKDVSQEYANLKAELDAAAVVYNKMLEALQKRQTTIPEAMRLESELTPILRRIENLKNKIEYLNNSVSFTTINVYFHESAVSSKVLKESTRSIKENMLVTAIRAIRFLASALPIVLMLGVILGIVIAITCIVKYWIMRLFKRG